MRRCYVYALTRTALPPLRAYGKKIESLAVGPLYASVARMQAAPTVSEETLARQHALVVRLSARADGILPMRFGAFVTLEELRHFVALHDLALVAALDLVRGREQMTVRVFGPAEPPKPRRLSPPSSGTEYLRGRRDAAGALPAAAGIVRRAARAFVVAERTARGEGHLRATLWHLIDSGTSESYRAAVLRSASRVPASVQLAVSGPCPPFAFAPDLPA